MAGKAKYPDGSEKIIVAGGVDAPGSSTSAVFDLNTQLWSPGPDLPYSLYSAASVQFGDTFLFIGGAGESDYTDTILQFDPATETFIQRTEKLGHKKIYTASFLVPDNYANCSVA